MFRLILQGGACFALLACVVGCPGGGGGDHPDTAPVTGTVKYGGKMVEGAMVTFAPASGSGHASIGVTNEQGVYTLKTTWSADGAVPGKYKVTVTKTEGGGAAGSDEGEEVEMVIEEEGAEKPSAVTDSLPAKYGSIETTDLEYEVKTGEDNNFPLELKD